MMKGHFAFESPIEPPPRCDEFPWDTFRKVMEDKMKIDQGKPKLALVYTSFINATARVREYGLIKYPDAENWRTTPTVDHYNALLRHVLAAKAALLKEAEGSELDDESGLHHLAHAACNIMFLIEEMIPNENI